MVQKLEKLFKDLCSIKKEQRAWRNRIKTAKDVSYLILFKKWWNKSHFLKMYPDSKQEIRKPWDLQNVLPKKVWGSVRQTFWKMCNIEANIEYFAFLSCCNLIFSQKEIIIYSPQKFFKIRPELKLDGFMWRIFLPPMWNIVASFLQSINICKQ